MLGTTIIAAALATGDTMSQTIRSSAVAALGEADVVVAARGVEAPLSPQSTSATGARYFPESYAARIARASARSGLVDGVAPAIVEPIAVQDMTSRQNEPRVTLFASTPESLRAFGPMKSGSAHRFARGPQARRGLLEHRGRFAISGRTRVTPLRVLVGRSTAAAARSRGRARTGAAGPPRPDCSCRSRPPSSFSASPG